MEELLLPIRKDRFWAASKLLSENNMSESVNNKKSIVKKYFFRLITKKFIKPPKKFLYITLYYICRKNEDMTSFFI